jgi:hypothetical protein
VVGGTSFHHEARRKEAPAGPQLQMQRLFMPQQSHWDVIIHDSSVTPLPATPIGGLDVEFFLVVHMMMIQVVRQESAIIQHLPGYN